MQKPQNYRKEIMQQANIFWNEKQLIVTINISLIFYLISFIYPI